MSEFKREDRYVVVKRSDLDKIPNTDVKHRFLSALAEVNNHSVQVGQRQFVVIEADWPEYEQVWEMIQNRVEGKAATPSEDGREVPKFDRRAIADRVNRMCVLMAGANTLNAAEFAVEECQAELERIVAAKDAEIERLRRLHDAAEDHNHYLREEIKELPAQPARQVGGDDRCPTCDGTGDVHSPDGEWKGRCHCQPIRQILVGSVWIDAGEQLTMLLADEYPTRDIYLTPRAALAPAAVVEPVATILGPDPYDERSGFAVSLADRIKLDSLPSGTKLYVSLNRRAISLELLERCAERLEYHMCSECKDATCCMPGTRAAAVELRALLGKEGE